MNLWKLSKSHENHLIPVEILHIPLKLSISYGNHLHPKETIYILRKPSSSQKYHQHLLETIYILRKSSTSQGNHVHFMEGMDTSSLNSELVLCEAPDSSVARAFERPPMACFSFVFLFVSAVFIVHLFHRLSVLESFS